MAAAGGAGGAGKAVAADPFFIGQFPLTVDDKGRLLIPSEVRKELNEDRDGKSFILITGPNGQLWLYPETFYKERIAPRSSGATPDPDEMDYSLMLYGTSAKLTPDKAGRVLLPDIAVDREWLGRNVVLVGVREHLELWRREDWQEFLQQNKTRARELAARFRNRPTPA